MPHVIFGRDRWERVREVGVRTVEDAGPYGRFREFGSGTLDIVGAD